MGQVHAVLHRIGHAIDGALPHDQTWTWEDRFHAALTILSHEQAQSFAEVLSRTCDASWAGTPSDELPAAVAELVGKMGGLRPEQHLFSCAIDEHSFAYISSWPWRDQTRVSIRFGLHQLGAKEEEIWMAKAWIKRGLEIP